MKHWAAVVVCFCFAVGTRAEEGASKAGQLNTTDAELKLLRRQVDDQRQKIEHLEAEVTAIRAHLRALGFESGDKQGPTSRSAPSSTPGANDQTRPRRVVFILAVSSDEARSEILRAINEMGDEQWFNIVVPQGRQASAYQTKLQQATDFNKKKVAEFLQRRTGWGSGELLVAIEAALKWRPELVWILTPSWQGTPADEDAFMKELRRINAVVKARINAVVLHPMSIGYLHMVWRMTADHGGVCLNPEGEAIDEPVLPFKPAPKPTPPPKPSILREPETPK